MKYLLAIGIVCLAGAGWWYTVAPSATTPAPLVTIASSTDRELLDTTVSPLVPAATTSPVVLPPTDPASRTFTYEDEGIFTFVLNPETVQRFSGKDAWTQTYDDYYYVAYQEPSRARMEKVVRLDAIAGFTYAVATTYKIEVARTRSATYGALDASWYDYQLVRIVEQKPVVH